MRCFVTTAQEAALREELAAAAQVQHDADLAMRDIAQDRMLERVQAGHAAEVARLHADCAVALDWRTVDAQQVQSQHDAEVARLREDRAAELARLADPQGPFVAHLIAEVAFWRLQFSHERQRAEVAIDQCRATHQAIGPVTVAPRPLTLEEPNQFMDELLKNADFAAMGQAAGVER